MDKDIMKCFIGKVIKVDRGGPESKMGLLMDASNDLIVLLTEDDGIVYYNMKHIKSFTDNLKEHFKLDLEVPKDFKFIKAENFQELLDSLKFKWIKINRGGPEKLEGVLTGLDNDSVFLINGQEIVRLSLSHIRSISYGLKIEKAKNEKSNENSQNKKKKSNSNKSTSKKTNSKNADMALAYPLSIEKSTMETVVENTENNLSIPLSTMETSQVTEVEDDDSGLSIPLSTMDYSQVIVTEDGDSDLSIPLSTMDYSQVIDTEDDDSDLSIPTSTMEPSEKIVAEEAESDLAILFTVMEKFIRKYSNPNQN
ncbi:hypothetical protein V7139_26750 [Neobacillus drentensis]|uniref:hypothetical protein n=1 Tax=Neobacillus drentensis TaxID=220684 RepID=UPI0030036A31